MLPFFPLANGLLTGKVRRAAGIPDGLAARRQPRDYVTDDKLDRVEQLAGWAEQHGRTVLDVAIAWLVAHPAAAR